MRTTPATNVPAATGLAMPSVPARLIRGAVGGLAGGLLFGAMMQLTGAIPMVAMLVGSESVAVGWAVHLAISVVLGLGFGLVVGDRLSSVGASLGLGAGYGVVWWVLGGLIAMPLALGMPAFVLNTMAWMSLMGHLVFGLTLGLVGFGLGRRVG